MKSLSRRGKCLLLLTLTTTVLLALVVAGLGWRYHALWVPHAAGWFESAKEMLNNMDPVMYFLVMAVLPVVPVPTLPFYLGVGLFPLHIAIPGLLFAVVVNLTLSYWMAAGILRPLAEATARRVNYKLPVVSQKNAAMVTLLLRVSGLPYSAQNYLSALAGVPFKTFMLVSVPMQLAFGTALMFLGDSFIKGKGGMALLSLSILVALIIAVKLLRGRLEQRRAAARAREEESACETPLAP